jgi:hypothetical protein
MWSLALLLSLNLGLRQPSCRRTHTTVLQIHSQPNTEKVYRTTMGVYSPNHFAGIA